MAKNKKSFILYADLLPTIEALSDKEAGVLFKHLLRYVNDQNPCCEDRLVAIVFEPIKQQLKRDLKDWEDEREKRSKAGHLGGLASAEARRSKSKQNKANPTSASNGEANQADNVNVTVNDTVNESKKQPSPILTTEQQNKWKKAKEFIAAEADSLLKFEQPITPEEFVRLLETFEGYEVEKAMRALDNFKNGHKKYKSVYKTLIKWIKLDRERAQKV